MSIPTHPWLGDLGQITCPQNEANKPGRASGLWEEGASKHLGVPTLCLGLLRGRSAYFPLCSLPNGLEGGSPRSRDLDYVPCPLLFIYFFGWGRSCVLRHMRP